MKKAVEQGFAAFTSPLEGLVPFMYCDVRGLVTCAIGNLIDPVGYALHLPWVHEDGTDATATEIEAEWRNIKARQDLRTHGGMAYKAIATLHLTDEGVQDLVKRKLVQNDTHIAARFVYYEAWPADAQLAVHSIAWAVGPGFRFPMLEAALRSQNFTMAAIECTINETGNPGLKPRNEANRILFRNAARVQQDGLNPEALYWPDDLTRQSAPESEETVIHNRDALTAALAAMRNKDPEGEES